MTAETPMIVAVPLTALHPADWNPRSITDTRFQNLCASIQADPELLWRRPVLAQADGTIYAGNMRYRAAEHLGFETIPAIVEEVPTSSHVNAPCVTTPSGARGRRMTSLHC